MSPDIGESWQTFPKSGDFGVQANYVYEILYQVLGYLPNDCG